jgi:hypothetical protein
LPEELVEQIRQQGKKRGCTTASAFMRAAIERELAGPETTSDGTEKSASPPRLTVSRANFVG